MAKIKIKVPVLIGYRGISGIFYPINEYLNIEIPRHHLKPIPKNEYPLTGEHEWKYKECKE